MKRFAVATSDRKHVNQEFGRSDSFLIYQMDDKKEVVLLEERKVDGDASNGQNTDCQSGNAAQGACGGANSPWLDARIALVEDCVCVLCSRIGPGAENRLLKKDISAFAVQMPISDALKKIAEYYGR